MAARTYGVSTSGRDIASMAGGLSHENAARAVGEAGPSPAVARPRGRVGASVRFLLVGLAGIGVNQMLLWLLSGGLGIHYLLGAIIASQGSTAFNFAGNEVWVFRRREGGSIVRRFLAFETLNGIALAARIPLLYLLVSVAGIHYLVANLIAIVALTAARFAISDTLIWANRHEGGV